MKTTMYHLIITWLSLISLVTVGCSVHNPNSSYRMPSARPPQIRGDLGTIGIVSANFKPECNFPKQVFAGEAFADGIKMGAIGGATQGLLAPLTNPFAIPLLPITVGGGAALGAVVGGTAGALQAPSKSKTEMARGEIKNATEEFNVQEAMRDLVINNIRKQTPYELVLLEGQGPATLDEAVSYGSLEGKGIDMVLEISVRKYGFWSGSGVNPPHSFFMTASSRLIRVRDGAVLQSKTFRYETGQRKFINWGANNAQPFKEEFDLCSQYLARKIVRKVFFLPESREENDADFNLVQRDNSGIASRAKWMKERCGFKSSSSQAVSFIRGALVVTNQQLSFLAWDGQDYETLLEFDYDKISKAEVKSSGRAKRLVIYANDNCFTFEFIKENSVFIDRKTTVEMADFISKKIEIKE